jgi:hypothetical protein
MVEKGIRSTIKKIAVRALQRQVSAATDRHVSRNIAADTLPDLWTALLEWWLLNGGRPKAKAGKRLVHLATEFKIGRKGIVYDFMRARVRA